MIQPNIFRRKFPQVTDFGINPLPNNEFLKQPAVKLLFARFKGRLDRSSFYLYQVNNLSEEDMT